MYLENLHNLIQSGVDIGAYPGATYAVILKDKVYMNVVGLKAKYPQEEVNSIDTIYDMASVSKVATTTTCILKLIEMGKLRLFDKVQLFVPEFKYENIMVYHLVTHTSGLQPCLYNPSQITSKEEAWEKVLNADVNFECGSDMVYSDLNYIMLGKIVEVISGMPLDVFAKKYIYDPLGMTDTSYNPVDVNRCAPTEERNDPVVQGIVRGKVHDETAYILGGVAGHAGMFSTIKDMSKFLQMILNKGTYNGNKVLSPITVDKLFKPLASKTVGNSCMKLQRSIGWIVKDYNSSSGDLTSEETIDHTGFTGTNVWVDRINEVAFCMLSNRVHPTRNNTKHMRLRVCAANYIMANLEEIKKEIEEC